MRIDQRKFWVTSTPWHIDGLKTAAIQVSLTFEYIDPRFFGGARKK